MLQISNLDDGKSEWNLNETHIIIPMIEGDIISKEPDKVVRNTITLNALDGNDQTVLSNGLEHSLVIGLDRNLFETYNNKSDLLVIQNSDLKLLSCNSESKTPVAYTLSYVDQDRNEILWESPVLKDRAKSEWCPSDKAIFEVKDVLNYDDSVQDSSKNWRDELEKSNEQINLDDVGGDLSSQVSKIDEGILIPIDDAITEDKKQHDIDEDSHFIVNYYPQMRSCGTISMLPTSTIINVPSQVEKVENSTAVSSEIKNDVAVSKNVTEIFDSLKWNKPRDIAKGFKEPQGNILDTTPQEVVEEYNEDVPAASNASDCGQYETDSKINFTDSLKVSSDVTKEHKIEGKRMINGTKSYLPEKSLPLKKKAKMKRTILSCGIDGSRSLLKQDSEIVDKNESLESTREPVSNSSPPMSNFQSNNSSDSDEPLINKVRKRKKLTKMKSKHVQEKTPNYLVIETNQDKEAKQICSNLVDVDKLDNDKESKSTKFEKNNFEGLDKSKINTIYELVEGLKKCRLINTSVWQTLNLGLKEMDVDILKEMNRNQDNEVSNDGTSYSAQLKAFALVLYFKQPAAFNHLAKVYESGWPSLNVIKDWKRRVNSHQRPNFVGIQRSVEGEKL